MPLFSTIQKKYWGHITKQIILTRKVWHRLKFFFPELWNSNAFTLGIFCISRHSLLIGMLHHLFKIIWMNSVQNIKEVLARWSLTNWIGVRKILREFIILFKLRPQCLNWKFIVMWHSYLLYIYLFQKLFFAGEHIFQKVFIDYIFFRQVILNYSGVSVKLWSYLRCLSR